MATSGEKLAVSLEVLQQVQTGNVVRSSSLSRVHRERLMQNDFLLEVVKGWYIVTRPALNDGSSTPWFASYWTFIATYLNDRYGDGYCLQLCFGNLPVICCHYCLIRAIFVENP